MRILTALCLITLAAAPAGAATRNFGVSGFDRIRIDGPYKVRVTTGVPPSAVASGPQRSLDGVTIEVQGRTLIVRNAKQSWGGFPDAASGPVEIALSTHDLSAAWVNGSGSVAINKVRGLSFDLSVQGSGSAAIAAVDVDQFKLNIAGSGSASLAGKVEKLTAVVQGISSLDAGGLRIDDAVFSADGPASIKATVTDTAKVQAHGTTAIELAGRPSCTVRATGSASISGCK